MGQGHTKRFHQKRKLGQWRELLDALSQRTAISSPAEFVDAHTSGLPRGSREQAIAVVRRFTTSGGRCEVLRGSLLRELRELETKAPRAGATEAGAARAPAPAPPAPAAAEGSGATGAAGESAPEAVGGREPTHRLLSLCKLTLAEAQELLRECGERGGLPDYFSAGFPTRFGLAAWALFKNHGLATSAGVGRGALNGPDRAQFEFVRFTLWPDLRRRQRWTELPDEFREDRKSGTWLEELRAAVARAEQATPQPAPAAREPERLSKPALPPLGLEETRGRLASLRDELVAEVDAAQADFELRLERAEAGVQALRVSDARPSVWNRRADALRAEVAALDELRQGLGPKRAQLEVFEAALAHLAGAVTPPAPQASEGT